VRSLSGLRLGDVAMLIELRDGRKGHRREVCEQRDEAERIEVVNRDGPAVAADGVG
jgi:hypothetical protein